MRCFFKTNRALGLNFKLPVSGLGVAALYLCVFAFVLIASSALPMPSHKTNAVATEKSIENVHHDTNEFSLHSLPYSNDFAITTQALALQLNFPSFEKRDSNLHLKSMHLRRTKQKLSVFYNIQLNSQSEKQLQGYYFYTLCKMLI